MRLLFVSSTTGGGSGRSQRELARHLMVSGHDVHFLVDDKSPARGRRWIYEQLSDLAVRVGDRPGGQIVRALERLPGRRTETLELEGFTHVTTPVPQNAVERVLDDLRPDVVVGNSLVRLSWRRIRAACERRHIPTVLYVREITSFDHLLPDEMPDAVVANARSLVAAVEERGVACAYVPSVVDLSSTRTDSTREVALVINLVATHGIDLVWELAGRLPEIPFVLQESWPLDSDALTRIRARAADLPNVEFRRAQPPGPELYGDARILLVPHRIDNRPRVITEAQSNGIPVITSSHPGLAEAVGDGGVTVNPDDVDAWCDQIGSLWTDGERYADLSQRALLHSQRAELGPERITAAFERVLTTAIASAAPDTRAAP